MALGSRADDRARRFDRAAAYVHRIGYRMLSTSYVNSRTYFEIRCDAEHLWRVRPDQLTGRRCPYCRVADGGRYGEVLIERLARDLGGRLGRGFSRSNLFQMRAFYTA